VGNVSGDGTDYDSEHHSSGYADYVYGVYAGTNVMTFDNSGAISATATAGNAEGAYSVAEAYDVYGVYLNYGANTFSNSGTITATATVGDAAVEKSFVYVNEVYGVYLNGATEFDNSGKIIATATAGNAEGVSSKISTGLRCFYGVYFDDYVGSFTNSGTIQSILTVGNANGEYSSVYAYDVYGVYLNGATEFDNSGTISATATVGDAAGDSSGVSAGGVYGVYSGNELVNFDNSGKIIATATAGNAEGDPSATAGNAEGDPSYVYAGNVYGVDFEGNVNNFTNSGTISAAATVGDAAGEKSSVYVNEVYGVYLGNELVNFTNSGKIIAVATAGDAEGVGSGVYTGWSIYGVDAEDVVGSFTNSGTIQSVFTVGSAIGDGSSTNAHDVYGVYFENDVGRFDNSGKIIATATVGNAAGDSSKACAYNVYGVVFDDGVGNFTNSGTLGAGVQTGDNATINSIAAVVVAGADDARITNSGTVATQIAVGNNATVENTAALGIYNSTAKITNTGNIDFSIQSTSGTSSAPVYAAAVGIENSTVTISNPGAIRPSTNIDGADIRTLAALSSNVTFADRFSVVFGSPGITTRPIYIDENSTLNLNNTTLIARAGRDLQFNTPYGVIENDGGVVNGAFAQSLKKGFINPDVTAAWVDSSVRDADAGVIFKYRPQGDVTGKAVNIAGVLLSRTIDRIYSAYHNPSMFVPLLAEGDKAPVMYAAAKPASASDVTYGSQRDASRNGLFLLPYYTNVSDGGVGADADSYGFLLGYNRMITDGLSIGIFGGYSSSNIDFTDRYSGNDEDQDAFTMGLHLLYDRPMWFVDAMVSYNQINHEYSGRTGANLDIMEYSDYDSTAVVSQAIAGLKFRLGGKVGIYPNLGVRWTAWSTDDHITRTYASWMKHYDSVDENWVVGIVGINADAAWKPGANSTLRLYGGVKLEEALGNDDLEIAQSLQGIRAYMNDGISDTSVVGTLGIQYLWKNFSVSLDVEGEHNADFDAYSAFGRLAYRF